MLIDGRLDLPHEARLMAGAPPLVFCGELDAPARARADALRARGAEVVSLANARGSVDLAAVLAELGCRGDNELHVEAGRTLSGALLRAGLVDELLVYVAPSLLGADAAAMFELSAPVSLESRVKLRFHDVERVGEDLRILARFEGGA